MRRKRCSRPTRLRGTNHRKDLLRSIRGKAALITRYKLRIGCRINRRFRLLWRRIMDLQETKLTTRPILLLITQPRLGHHLMGRLRHILRAVTLGQRDLEIRPVIMGQIITTIRNLPSLFRIINLQMSINLSQLTISHSQTLNQLGSISQLQPTRSP
jgi:EAL domain-containing protein (putative c-di-GMP-specific phosphodiesterase class I)